MSTHETSKKSPTGPTEGTPKPEYLIALATYLGPLIRSHSISQMLNVWYIYLHLPPKLPKCR